MGREVELISFGYARSGPPDVNVVLDCRKLPNPYNVRALRSMNGMDSEVKDFLLTDPKTHTLLAYGFGHAQQDDKIAFGCHGGQHRSVAVVEMIADRLRDDGITVKVTHLDL